MYYNANICCPYINHLLIQDNFDFYVNFLVNMPVHQKMLSFDSVVNGDAMRMVLIFNKRKKFELIYKMTLQFSLY